MIFLALLAMAIGTLLVLSLVLVGSSRSSLARFAGGTVSGPLWLAARTY